MAPRSNFRRAPLVTMVPGVCPVHGKIELESVQQFDGGVLIHGCRACAWSALNTAPIESDAYRDASTERQAKELNAALIATGITPRFAPCTFDNFRTDGDKAKLQALLSCQRYAQEFEEDFRVGRSLLMLGNIGTGKTHLASAIAQHVVRNLGATALLVSASEIIRLFKSAMDRAAGYGDRDLLAELGTVDLLLIDEVGAQAGTSYELGVMHEIIDRRYQLVVPTVLISNLESKALAQYIGDRALDRLRQGQGILAGFPWQSARARA